MSNPTPNPPPYTTTTSLDSRHEAKLDAYSDNNPNEHADDSQHKDKLVSIQQSVGELVLLFLVAVGSVMVGGRLVLLW